MPRQAILLGNSMITSTRTRIESAGQSHTHTHTRHSRAHTTTTHTIVMRTPQPYTSHNRVHHNHPHVDVCRVHGFSKPFFATKKQVADMILCRNICLGDMTVFDLFLGALTKSKTAHISGIRFTAGEPLEGKLRPGWESKRCGSVFTAVINGVSR